MSRSFDWGNGASRPVLDRAKFLSSVVKRDEFHVLLFVLRSLFPGLVETQVKRNIARWHTRRVSFWNYCGEQMQEWLHNVMESVDSVDFPLRVEGQVSLESAL